MMLQAVGGDKNGSRKRRIKAKTFKKIDDLWMLKDLDVYNYDTRNKTNLRIMDVKSLDRKGEPVPLETDLPPVAPVSAVPDPSPIPENREAP